MGKMKSWLMDQEENNFNFPCDDCGDIIKAWDGEASFETRNGTYVCEVCIDNSRGDKCEAARPMDEMLDEVFSTVLGADW